MASKAQTLAKIKENDAAQRGPIAKLTDPPAANQSSTSESAVDDHDVHVGIIRHLGLDFSLGAALEQIGEARRLTGGERHAKIERAVRYLNEELQHC